MDWYLELVRDIFNSFSSLSLRIIFRFLVLSPPSPSSTALIILVKGSDKVIIGKDSDEVIIGKDSDEVFIGKSSDEVILG